MSPQSKGRKRRNKPAGIVRRVPPEPENPQAARAAQAAMRTLEGAPGALDAELFVSEQLGTRWGTADGRLDFDHDAELDEAVVAYAARRRGSSAVVLLRAVAVLSTDPLRSRAVEAADALVARGVEEPAWARAFGTERVTGVWAHGDVFGDQTTVVLAVERGDERYGVMMLIDRNQHAVVHAFVVDDPDEALAALGEGAAEGPPMADRREVPLDEAARLFDHPLFLTDLATLGGPVPMVFADVYAIVAARVRSLPEPAAAPEPRHFDDAAQTAVVDEFLASEQGRDLPPGARGIAQRLVEFGDAVEPADPLRVGPGKIDVFLDETLNAAGVPVDEDDVFGDPILEPDDPEDWYLPELAPSDEEVDALPATVRAWAEWAGRRAGLSDEVMAYLRENVDDMVLAIGRPNGPVPEPEDVADAYLAGLDLDAVAPEDLPGVLERRMFAAPAVGTRIGDERFPFLDPSDPDDRSMLIEGEHPEYHEALADPDFDTTEVNPRLHILIHEIVANQLWDDTPPEVWQAARRLTAGGMDRHDVLHTIGEVMAKHLHGVLNGDGQADNARYVAEVEKLGRAEPAKVVPIRRKR